MFVIFSLLGSDIQLLQGQIIHATKCRQAGQSRHVGLFSEFLPACDENQNYAHWELFATRCCLYSKPHIFLSFDIEGLHSFASTLSHFARSTRAAWTADFSFSLV
jgi:hypothetical protein